MEQAKSGAQLVLVLVVLGCGPSEDTCEETRTAIGYDDPGALGTTPRETMQHTEGLRSGVLTWAEGSATEITVVTTLDVDSAASVDSVHVGRGRLACFDSIVMQARIEISTADGALQESLDVELAGGLENLVEGRSDLSMHDFTGSLTWQPSGAPSQLLLLMSWLADEPGTLRGWLVWGDNDMVQVSDGLVVAQFETTLE